MDLFHELVYSLTFLTVNIWSLSNLLFFILYFSFAFEWRNGSWNWLRNSYNISGLSNDPSVASSKYSENSDEELQPQTKLQIFGEITWKGVPVGRANNLPNEMDGLKYYVIKDQVRNNLWTKCKDRRNLKRDFQKRWAGYKSVCYRNCKGLTFCPKKECLYYKEYQNENRFYISKKGVCKTCGSESTYRFCPAKEYVACERFFLLSGFDISGML